MAKWKQKPLGEITAFISKGIPPKYIDTESNSTIRVLNQKCNRNFMISYKEARLHDNAIKPVPREKLLRNGDVLINSTGTGTAGRVAQILKVPTPTTIDGHMILLRPAKELDFLYYGYAIKAQQAKIEELAEGSTGQTEINRKRLQEEIVITYPEDLRVQHNIGYFLMEIDDKIELNNAINNNLEQQAQALFKSWFIDFEPFDEPFIASPVGIKNPCSLEMIQIGNLPHVLETGKRPKGGALSSGIPSIGAENVKKLGEVNFSSTKYIPIEFAQKMNKGKVHGYELMLYKDGGKPGTFIPHFSMFGEGFPYDEFYINEHVFKLDFGNKGFNEFCYFYLQTDYPYHWLANNGGKAAVPGINQQDVNSIWIYHPDNPLVKEYCEWVQPIFTNILKNCSQNMKLSLLRDTLLPKLMSGELDISDIDL